MPPPDGHPGRAPAPPGEVTRLLGAWGAGDRAAADRLFALLYDELRRVAHRALAGQGREATLQTTALVHELYLRLAGGFRPRDDDRRRFFAAAATVMRRILVDRARERLAAKRGAGDRPEPLGAEAPLGGFAGGLADAERAAVEALAVDRAVAALERHDPRLARLVELRVFAGCSVEEAAGLLELSERTVKRDWRRARALLADWLGGTPG